MKNFIPKISFYCLRGRGKPLTSMGTEPGAFPLCRAIVALIQPLNARTCWYTPIAASHRSPSVRMPVKRPSQYRPLPRLPAHGALFRWYWMHSIDSATRFAVVVVTALQASRFIMGMATVSWRGLNCPVGLLRPKATRLQLVPSGTMVERRSAVSRVLEGSAKPLES